MKKSNENLFPYEKFPVRLEYSDDRESKICWFECEEHLQKYLEKYKLSKKPTKITYKDAKPIVRSKKHTGNMEQKPKSKSNRGSSTVRRRKSSVDSPRNSTRNSKPKK